jgi:hypothetical protein
MERTLRPLNITSYDVPAWRVAIRDGKPTPRRGQEHLVFVDTICVRGYDSKDDDVCRFLSTIVGAHVQLICIRYDACLMVPPESAVRVELLNSMVDPRSVRDCVCGGGVMEAVIFDDAADEKTLLLALSGKSPPTSLIIDVRLTDNCVLRAIPTTTEALYVRWHHEKPPRDILNLTDLIFLVDLKIQSDVLFTMDDVYILANIAPNLKCISIASGGRISNAPAPNARHMPRDHRLHLHLLRLINVAHFTPLAFMRLVHPSSLPLSKESCIRTPACDADTVKKLLGHIILRPAELLHHPQICGIEALVGNCLATGLDTIHEVILTPETQILMYFLTRYMARDEPVSFDCPHAKRQKSPQIPQWASLDQGLLTNPARRLMGAFSRDITSRVIGHDMRKLKQAIEMHPTADMLVDDFLSRRLSDSADIPQKVTKSVNMLLQSYRERWIVDLPETVYDLVLILANAYANSERLSELALSTSLLALATYYASRAETVVDMFGKHYDEGNCYTAILGLHFHDHMQKWEKVFKDFSTDPTLGDLEEALETDSTI